jgi:hypothetical protein
MEQKPDDKLTDKPMTGNYAFLPDFDFAYGTFDKGYEIGKFTEEYGKEQIARANGESVIGKPEIAETKHTRAMVNLRGRYFVVVDMIESDSPVEATALWRFHPGCTVRQEGNTVLSTDKGKGNARIVPAGPVNWSIELVKGIEKPSIQGWYSVRYNEKEPNTVAVCSGTVAGNQAFAWVIVPGRGQVANPEVTVLPSPSGSIRLSISLQGEQPTEIAVRLSGSEAIQVGNGLLLDGRCAVIPPEGKPGVGLGCLRDTSGHIQAEHVFTAYNLLTQR